MKSPLDDLSPEDRADIIERFRGHVRGLEYVEGGIEIDEGSRKVVQRLDGMSYRRTYNTLKAVARRYQGRARGSYRLS